jgi:hypothetical protein
MVHRRNGQGRSPPCERLSSIGARMARPSCATCRDSLASNGEPSSTSLDTRTSSTTACASVDSNAARKGISEVKAMRFSNHDSVSVHRIYMRVRPGVMDDMFPLH